jgi:hypothetical protein
VPGPFAEVLFTIGNPLTARTDRVTEVKDGRERNALQSRLSAVRRRIDQAYQDKLDGKIPEDFWERKKTEWTRDERSTEDTLTRLEAPIKDRLADDTKDFRTREQGLFSSYASEIQFTHFGNPLHLAKQLLDLKKILRKDPANSE